MKTNIISLIRFVKTVCIALTALAVVLGPCTVKMVVSEWLGTEAVAKSGKHKAHLEEEVACLSFTQSDHATQPSSPDKLIDAGAITLEVITSGMHSLLSKTHRPGVEVVPGNAVPLFVLYRQWRHHLIA